MTSTNPTTCLIRQSACGLQSGQTECPKCGIRTDARYVSREDLDMAVAKGTALYWQNHAQALEQTLRAQVKAEREQLERAEIERAKSESARVQAQKERQEADARRVQEKAQREAAEQRAAQEKAKREQLERAEIERAKSESARVQAQKEKQEAEARRAQEKAQREAAEQKAAQEKAKREQLERAEIERAKAESARVQALKEKQEADARRAQEKTKLERLEREEKERQAAVQTRRKPGQVFQDLPLAPEMVVLPSGSFLMGSADKDVHADDRERPKHKVTIGYQLAMGRYPVTFEEWDACVAEGGFDHKPEDQGWGRGKRPVINVSWEDAQAYATWLNKKLGITANDPTRYRLASEAEWEYACRAGTTGNFSTANGQLGDNDATFNASYIDASLSPRAGKYHQKTTPVGMYAANPWGLHDMHGNVWEWVQDDFENSYRGAPVDGTAWRARAAHRVLRGGCWNDFAKSIRSANRSYSPPDYRFRNFGFRLARTVL